MTLGGGCDIAGRSAQILSKTFPFAILALIIRVSAITVTAKTAKGILLGVEAPGSRSPCRADSSVLGLFCP